MLPHRLAGFSLLVLRAEICLRLPTSRQFRERLIELKLQAEVDEIDALFARLDASADGNLDLGECKAALLRVREAAAQEAQFERQKEATVSKRGKAAKGAQKAAAAALEEFRPEWTA